MRLTRTSTLALLSIAVLGGTLYSVVYHTYFDTSDPLLANLPHPLQHESLFAHKSNVFNIWFVKKAWGWTSAAIAALQLTTPRPRTRDRVVLSQWLAATVVWGTFAAWFFGPSLFTRLLVASGGTCIILHPVETLVIPAEYCYASTILSPRTHPTLFVSIPTSSPAEWTGRPRLAGGHDVSGHVFLLTLSVMFLQTHLEPAWRRIADGGAPGIHKVAVGLASVLLGLWLLMSLATSVYWHTPLEKITGFVFGLVGFIVTQIPFSSY